jgi:hypothetical protein
MILFGIIMADIRDMFVAFCNRNKVISSYDEEDE